MVLNIIIINEIDKELYLCLQINIESIDMNIIFIYSDMKINAKGPLEYSVLNPDTNSLSPSAKSNGARFVSANIVINQIETRIGLIKIILWLLKVRIFCKLNVDRKIRIEIKIIPILTS